MGTTEDPGPDGTTDLSTLAESLRESLRREGELREWERWWTQALAMGATSATAEIIREAATRFLLLQGSVSGEMLMGWNLALRELLWRMETKP